MDTIQSHLCGGSPGSTCDEWLDSKGDQQRLDASSYTCSVCFELLLDPVVGASNERGLFRVAQKHSACTTLLIRQWGRLDHPCGQLVVSLTCVAARLPSCCVQAAVDMTSACTALLPGRMRGSALDAASSVLSVEQSCLQAPTSHLVSCCPVLPSSTL
jgi:hypothetical protein